MEIQDGRYFCKIAYVFTDPQMDRSFESSKNLQRFDFLKDMCNSRGECAPLNKPRGDCSATLPNRCGRYQGTTPTTWLNFYTPCKSQLQNAWPVSPTTAAVERSHWRNRTGWVRSMLLQSFPRCLASIVVDCPWILTGPG